MAENKSQTQPTSASAPKQEGTQTPLSNQLGQPRPCPKDCRRCSMQQQICCASMLSFQSFEVMNGIIQRLDILSQHVSDFEQRMAAIQSSETELSSPLPLQGNLFAGTE